MISSMRTVSSVRGPAGGGSRKTLALPSAWQRFLRALLRGLAMAAA
jgi:hypothetical protein